MSIMVLLETIPLRLEVLTPVHIWNGSILVRHVDFKLDINRRKIQYIRPRIQVDIRELKKKTVQEALREIDKLLEFESFMELDLMTLDQQYLSAINEVYPAIKTDNIWYIPASSLKGIIRTAIVFDLVRKMEASYNLRKSVIALLQRVRNKRELKDIAPESIEKPLLKIQMRKYLADIFSNIILRESPKQSIRVAVRDVKVVRISDGKLVARPLVESIERTSSFEFELKIRHIPSNITQYTPRIYASFISRGDEILSKENIINALRVFSEYLLTLEIETIKLCMDTLRNIGIELDSYLQQLAKWREDLDKSNRYYLRLGRYCGYKSKTVVDAFTQSIYNDIRSIMLRFYRNWDLSTIKITEVDGKFTGMGWISISFK